MTITPYELLKELTLSVDFWGTTTGFNSDQLCEALTYAVSTIDTQAARIAELENDELRQRLANAEHQIYMKDLAIHNVKASRRAQFRARQAAEKELAALRTDNETLVAVNSELANELEVLRQSATPVAVPDKKERLENVASNAEIYLQGKGDGFNEAVDEVLRLNSGSKPE